MKDGSQERLARPSAEGQGGRDGGRYKSGPSVANQAMPNAFKVYMEQNYPPGSVITSAAWHASKIWSIAMRALADSSWRDHEPGCPLLQFWDGGDSKARCTCDDGVPQAQESARDAKTTALVLALTLLHDEMQVENTAGRDLPHERLWPLLQVAQKALAK